MEGEKKIHSHLTINGVRDIVWDILDRQDDLISRMGAYFSPDQPRQKRVEVYDNFNWRIHHLKEILWQHRKELSRDDFAEIRQRMQDQSEAIESRCRFLEKSLGRVID